MKHSFLLDFFLSFTHFPVVMPLIVSGYFFINKRRYLQAVSLVCFSMVVNVALKTTFKIPLSPSLHQIGFAFPSGHTQFATVLYGWLAWTTPGRLWKIVTLILIAGIGYALYDYHYHTVKDIIAGFITGVILIAIYQALLTHIPKKAAKILLATATILMGYNLWMYTHVPFHAWSAYGCLIMSIFFSSRSIQ